MPLITKIQNHVTEFQKIIYIIFKLLAVAKSVWPSRIFFKKRICKIHHAKSSKLNTPVIFVLKTLIVTIMRPLVYVIWLIVGRASARGKFLDVYFANSFFQKIRDGQTGFGNRVRNDFGIYKFVLCKSWQPNTHAPIIALLEHCVEISHI